MGKAPLQTSDEQSSLPYWIYLLPVSTPAACPPRTWLSFRATRRPASACRPSSAAASEQDASSTALLRARTAAWHSTSSASGVTTPTHPCAARTGNLGGMQAYCAYTLGASVLKGHVIRPDSRQSANPLHKTRAQATRNTGQQGSRTRYSNRYKHKRPFANVAMFCWVSEAMEVVQQASHHNEQRSILGSAESSCTQHSGKVQGPHTSGMSSSPLMASTSSTVGSA